MLSGQRLGAMMVSEVESSERPSTIIDVGRAMSTGRSRRQYRRATASVLAVAAAVSAIVVGVVVGAGQSGPRPERAQPDGDRSVAAGQGQADPYAIGTAPAVLDPTIRYLRAGWLPDGLPHRSYGVWSSGPPGGDPSASLLAGAGGDPNGPGVRVSLYPRDVTPPAPAGTGGRVSGPTLTPAPPVHGRPARWATYPAAPAGVTTTPARDHRDPQRRDFLEWEYAPGGWVRVEARGLGPDGRTIASRVAGALTIGDTEHVRLPFQLPDLPPTIRLDSLTLSENQDSGMSATAFAYFTSAPPGADSARVNSSTLSIGVTPYGGEDRTGGKGFHPPNTTVDGHSAAINGEPGRTQALNVYDVDGFNVSIAVDGTEMTGLLGNDGCLDVYHRIQPTVKRGTWSAGLDVPRR